MRSERIGRDRGALLLRLAGLLAGLAAGGASAAPGPALPPEPVVRARLEVEAPASCATRETIAALATARSPRIQLTDEAGDVPELRAVLRPGPHGTQAGELTLIQPGGRRSVRRLTAASCAELADALGLVIALTLDPALATEPPGAPGGSSGPREPAAPPASPSSSPSSASPPPPAPPPAVETPATAPLPVPGPPEVAPRRRLGVGAAFEATSGPAPRFLPGLSLEVLAALDRPSIWSPAVRLGASHTAAGGLLEAGGTADFALDAVALDACPLALRPSGFEARACAVGMAGRLSTRGSRTYEPQSSDRPFVALGASVLLSVTVLGRFELAGRLAATAPLFRDTFQFAPAVFHRVASATLVGDLGVRVRFP